MDTISVGDTVEALETHYDFYVQGCVYKVINVEDYGIQLDNDFWGDPENFKKVYPLFAEILSSPWGQQIGGTHYKDMAIQPAAYILANGIGWAEGDAIAYISRWKAKGGVQDLKKAIGTLNLLIASVEAADGHSA